MRLLVTRRLSFIQLRFSLVVLPSNSSFDLDVEEEYNMKHKRRGLALIFNQERFYWQLGMHDRSGSEADCQKLKYR